MLLLTLTFDQNYKQCSAAYLTSSYSPILGRGVENDALTAGVRQQDIDPQVNRG